MVVWSLLFISILKTLDLASDKQQSQKQKETTTKMKKDHYSPLIVEEDIHHQNLVKVVGHPKVKESVCGRGAPRKHIVRRIVSKSRIRKVTRDYSFCPPISLFVLWLPILSRLHQLRMMVQYVLGLCPPRISIIPLNK